MKYLHTVSDGVYYLDHRLTPEVRAMICAMASRMPLGGVKARYQEVVNAVAKGLYEQDQEASPKEYPFTWAELYNPKTDEWTPRHNKAEDRLCQYPIHPKVQEFFDKFVKMYGHGSIMELTGSPSVYVEGISWYTAYLLFDNPLVAGQEFSTRAVRHKDWPMARECFVSGTQGGGVIMVDQEEQVGPTTETTFPHPKLKALHDGWFEVFEAEVAAWKEKFSDPEVRKEYGIADKEPFRPALDRARWAIPGTIATGCSQTASLRTMARVLQTGSLLAQASGAEEVIKTWEDIAEGYKQSIPAMADMGLREAVYDANSLIPGHTQPILMEVTDEVSLGLVPCGPIDPHAYVRTEGEKVYVDPCFNNVARVNIVFQCSLAVSRDWHRHRTFYPWRLNLVRGEGDLFRIHHAYKPISELGKTKVPGLLKLATEAFDEFAYAGDMYRAMLCLPLGTLVEMEAWGGLRDAIYMLELRKDAHGANFEYKAQAQDAMAQLIIQMHVNDEQYLKWCDRSLTETVGLNLDADWKTALKSMVVE